MDCNQYLSDDNSSKDEVTGNEYHNPDKIEKNQVIEKQDISINKILNVEEFEKAFNIVFDPKGKDLFEIESEEEEKKHPFIPEIINENPVIKRCPDEKIVINVEEKNDDKYFPFTKGIGLEKTLDKICIKFKYNSQSKVTLYNNENYKCLVTSKFKTIDYYTDEKGKKKRTKKKRKFKPDDIRKKIKARFHKVIKNLINTKLKKAGSQKLFDFLPQSFITNITINLNHKVLDLTYEKLIEEDFITPKNSQKNTDKEKYYKNLEVLSYLKENLEISKNSEFERIKKMKYIDILKAYFLSKEFEESVIELYNKKEKIGYIEEYVNKALTYINFFAFNKKYNKNNIIKLSFNNDDEEEGEEEEDSGYECE